MAKTQGKTKSLGVRDKIQIAPVKAVATAANALRAVMTVLRPRLRIVLVGAGVLVLLLVGVWWWTRPTRPVLLSDKEIFQQQQQVTEKAAKKDKALVLKRDVEIAALQQK